MPVVNDLPSYEQLFGDIDFKQGDPARTVFSPAAYLADLIGFVENYFNRPDLFDQPDQPAGRREDIKRGIPFDASHTFTMVPYLDVVIRILEQAIGESEDIEASNIYDKFMSGRYPFELPANVDHERLKLYLTYLRVGAEEIYSLFAGWHQGDDPDAKAREYLGLTPELAELLTTPVSPYAVAADYGQDSLEALHQTETFLRVTGLSGSELYELLFQRLSTKSLSASGDSEREAAIHLYINQGLNGYVRLDAEDQHMVWSGPEEQIPAAWFDRVSRMVRLARRTGLSFTDLDLILRSCCGSVLDARALRVLAVLLHLHRSYDQPIATLCVLAGGLIDTLGHGSEGDPADLFHSTFNGRYAHIDKTYIPAPGHPYVPEAYAGYQVAAFQGDILDQANKPLRRRILAGLGLSEKEFSQLVTAFRQAASEGAYVSVFTGSPDHDTWSALYRFARLRDMLELSVTDLLDLLGLLALDPYLRVYPQFPILLDDPGVAEDTHLFPTFRMMEKGASADNLWLLQITLAVARWMQEDGASAPELREILTGEAPDQATAQARRLALLQALYQQVLPTLLVPEHLEVEGDARMARALYRSLKASESGILSQDRILRFEEEAAYHAVYSALKQLPHIHPEDLIGLGLEERMLNQIYSQLILLGYLAPDGVLNESAFPSEAARLILATDFSGIKEKLYALIHRLYAAEEEAGSPPAEVEFSLFPADLDALYLSRTQQEELYNNLIFNGYLDPSGAILRADIFAAESVSDDFDPNTPLQAYASRVFDHIWLSVSRFEQELLTFDPQSLGDIGIPEAEIEDLVLNLQFNGYLDTDRRYTHKSALLALDSASFNIELAFYSRRHKILAALQSAVKQFKAQYFRFPRESFAALADGIQADLIYRHLSATYFPEGVLTPDAEAFFADSGQLDQFTLPAGLDVAEARTVFEHLAQIVATQRQLQVSTPALTEIGLDEDDQDQLFVTLQSGGWTDAAGHIAGDKIAFFLNINHALSFQVAEFHDYSKDIFFVLNAVALAVDSRIRVVTGILSQAAANQYNAVMIVLQEHLGIGADIAGALAKAIWGAERPLTEAIVVPVLAVADTLGRITREPVDHAYTLNMRRLRQLSLLATRMSFTQAEAEVALHDQNLVDKFPEPFVLPAGFSEIDALLKAVGDHLVIADVSYKDPIYVFSGRQYWAYDPASYILILPPSPLAGFAPELADWSGVDAAYTDAEGVFWLVSGTMHLCKTPGGLRWEPREHTWGQVRHPFDTLARVDASMVDTEGRTYLFLGDQYVRYSGNYSYVDEGYPRTIAGNWKNELSDQKLPDAFYRGIGASFTGPDQQSYLFSGSSWVSSADYTDEKPVSAFWGRVRNTLSQMERVDSAVMIQGTLYLSAGDQVMAYTDHPATPGVTAAEGSLTTLSTWLPGVPDAFES
ncbi:MAG: hypothetical protein EAZ89_18955, partial [Bacteroidetes bacterium]